MAGVSKGNDRNFCIFEHFVFVKVKVSKLEHLFEGVTLALHNEVEHPVLVNF